jgi:hypothetical protein
MEHLTINGIKNKSDDWDVLLTDKDRHYIAEFTEKHKQELYKKQFDMFCDLEFLRPMLKSSRSMFFNMLLDVSENYTLNFLNTLIDFTPFKDDFYVYRVFYYGMQGRYLNHKWERS